MEIALGIGLVVNLYALVYYRLLVRWFLEHDGGVKETVFAALLSPPPWRALSPLGKKYARRYFVALGTMAALMGLVALLVGVPKIA